MTTFFIWGYIYHIKIDMLFNVNLGSGPSFETLLISGSSWSNCLSYCEGTGKQIQSIQLSDAQVVLDNISLGYCYLVIMRNNSTSLIASNLIYDTFENVLVWISSQSGFTFQSMSKQNRAFVSI